MSEPEQPAGPLILQQDPKRPKREQPLPYEFGSDIYRVYRNPKNPFLERILGEEAEGVALTPEQTQRLFQQMGQNDTYRLGYVTETSAVRKRRVADGTPNTPQSKGEFPRPEQFPSGPERIRVMMTRFFQETNQRLREHPGQLGEVVNELVPLFEEQGLRIRVPELFRQFQSNDAFLQTLEQVSEDDEVENFELFCAALFGFYSQQG